jgi:hypothetical protein
MTKLELMHLTATTLHERAAYIVANADAIGVRIHIGGRPENLILAELPAQIAIREAFRLLLRAETPHRKLRPDEARCGHCGEVVDVARQNAHVCPTREFPTATHDPKVDHVERQPTRIGVDPANGLVIIQIGHVDPVGIEPQDAVELAGLMLECALQVELAKKKTAVN